MSRAAWTVIIGSLVALGIAIGAVAAFLGDDEGSTRSFPSAAQWRGFVLPLAGQPRTLALGGHDRNLLVGIAARGGGPLELAALRGEGPIPTEELRVELNGRVVRPEPCGKGCSRLSGPVLAGRADSLTVRQRYRPEAVSFNLPDFLPPNGNDVFDKASRTMSALRTYRYTERLSSGLGRTVNSTVDVQAPDRMRLRTKGFSSVIIGQTRWDRHEGAKWERNRFPGLDVKDLLMWHQAKNPRVTRLFGNGEAELVAFGLKPVPAWFRLDVEPSGRVTEAEMTAASHFMLHRYGNYDRGAAIKPPR